MRRLLEGKRALLPVTPKAGAPRSTVRVRGIPEAEGGKDGEGRKEGGEAGLDPRAGGAGKAPPDPPHRAVRRRKASGSGAWNAGVWPAGP